MFSPLRRIAPAPRKPMPVTTCAATRSGEPAAAPNSTERIENSADPSAMSMFVLSPAGLWRYSRSSPIAPPSAAASASRSMASEKGVGVIGVLPLQPREDLSQQVFEIGLRRAGTLRNRSRLFRGLPRGLGIAANSLRHSAKFLRCPPQFFVHLTLPLVDDPLALLRLARGLLRLTAFFCLNPQLFTGDSQLLRHFLFFLDATTSRVVLCKRLCGVLSFHGGFLHTLSCAVTSGSSRCRPED